MFEKAVNKFGKLLNGKTFENFVAMQVGGTVYGGPGQPDVVTESGEVIECKFFTRRSATGRSSTDYYGYSSGFILNGKSNLLAQLREYCNSFDKLAVGIGDFLKNDDCDWTLMDSDAAFNWLAPRLCAKGYEEIRFAFEAEPMRDKELTRRTRRLIDNGFSL